VRTFIQSGNVLFESPARNAPVILRRVKAKLRPVIGDEPEILLRSVREVERLVEESPFSGRGGTAGAKLYVAFLSRRPRRKPAFPLSSSKEALEARRQDLEAASDEHRP
jgi:uncharacterized protein (DUF1697 family)